MLALAAPPTIATEDARACSRRPRRAARGKLAALQVKGAEAAYTMRACGVGCRRSASSRAGSSTAAPSGTAPRAGSWAPRCASTSSAAAQTPPRVAEARPPSTGSASERERAEQHVRLDVRHRRRAPGDGARAGDGGPGGARPGQGEPAHRARPLRGGPRRRHLAAARRAGGAAGRCPRHRLPASTSSSRPPALERALGRLPKEGDGPDYPYVHTAFSALVAHDGPLCPLADRRPAAARHEACQDARLGPPRSRCEPLAADARQVSDTFEAGGTVQAQTTATLGAESWRRCAKSACIPATACGADRCWSCSTTATCRPAAAQAGDRPGCRQRGRRRRRRRSSRAPGRPLRSPRRRTTGSRPAREPQVGHRRRKSTRPWPACAAPRLAWRGRGPRCGRRRRRGPARRPPARAPGSPRRSPAHGALRRPRHREVRRAWQHGRARACRCVRVEDAGGVPSRVAGGRVARRLRQGR